MNKTETILQASEKAFIMEEERTEKLNKKAEKIIGVIVIIIGLKLIDLEFEESLELPLLIISLLSFICFVTSMIVTLFSIRVRQYQGYPRETEIIDKLNSDEIDNNESQKVISIMYLNARENNAKINDKRATQLASSSFFLIIGFIFAIANRFAGLFFN